MTDHFDSHTARFLAAVAMQMPNVSGDVMQGWIENPKALRKALRAALCPPTETAEPETPKSPEIKIWRRIKLGTGLTTPDDFWKAITNMDFRIVHYGSDILTKKEFAAATKPAKVDLVRMSVKDFGFKGNARFDEICARAKEIGLELCPAEVGPQLRLQYLNQPKNERLIIAMEAIRDSRGYLRTFHVEHDDDGRWLSTGYGNCSYSWYPDREFVFVLPRK